MAIGLIVEPKGGGGHTFQLSERGWKEIWGNILEREFCTTGLMSIVCSISSVSLSSAGI